jgi:putative lipoprotein
MNVKRAVKQLVATGVAFGLLVVSGCGGGTDEEPVTVVGAQPDATATSTATVPTEPASPTGTAEATATATEVATPTPDPDANASVTGTVTYRERIALSPGAVVTVQLRDTSLMDTASELIAEQVITNPGQVPIAFEVRYNSDDINPRNTYSIQARITESDGRLAFINDTAYDVITRGNPTRIDMVLVIVQPPPDPINPAATLPATS